MAKPTKTDVYVDQLMTGLLKGYKNGSMIADILAPSINVQQLSGKYAIYGREQMYAEDDYIAPGAPANEIEWSVSYGTYSVDERGLKEKVPRIVSNASQRPIDVLQRAAEVVKDKVMLKKEIRVRDLLLNGCSSTTLTTAYQWDNYSSTSSTPLINFSTAKEAVRTALGVTPTHVVIPPSVAEKMSNHPDIVDLRKYTNPNLVQNSSIPSVIQGLQVIIPTCMSVATNAGTTMTDVWGQDVYFIYINPRPGINSLATLATFTYEDGTISRWYDQECRSDFIEYRYIVGEELISSEGCYIYKDVIA